jgi:hypothetical protein
MAEKPAHSSVAAGVTHGDNYGAQDDTEMPKLPRDDGKIAYGQDKAVVSGVVSTLALTFLLPTVRC